MKKLLLTCLLVLSPFVLSAKENTQLVKEQIVKYEKAVNSADLNAVAKLFSDDSVLMAQGNLPATGKQNVELAYKNIFANINLDIKFVFDDIVIIDNQYAIVQTRSNGTITLNNKEKTVIPEANQEIFILKNIKNNWLISKYIFNTTNSN